MTDIVLPPRNGSELVAPARLRIVMIDDDDLFRDQLTRNMVEEQIDIIGFDDGSAALAYLDGGGECHAVLLDWKMPKLSGFDTLRGIRATAPELPILIVTAFSSESNEIAALDHGAFDFLDKSRSAHVIATRLRLIVSGRRGTPAAQEEQQVLRIGELELRLKSNRASWREQQLPLTVTEFGIVYLLASRLGEEVTYRQIYDVVHGADFIAGDGGEGYRANVRSLIKRIRQKFRELDSDFAEIQNYPGFGYSWRRPEKPAEDRALLPEAMVAIAAAMPEVMNFPVDCEPQHLVGRLMVALAKLPFMREKPGSDADGRQPAVADRENVAPAQSQPSPSGGFSEPAPLAAAALLAGVVSGAASGVLGHLGVVETSAGAPQHNHSSRRKNTA